MNTPRYNGFTCPKCGSHTFGTHPHHTKFMGDKYPQGTRVGTCHEHQYSGNGCDFEWNRDDPEAEAAVIYKQTAEEWAAWLEEAWRSNA